MDALDHKRLSPELFSEFTDERLRAMLDQHLPPSIRQHYRVEGVTWCVNGKRWLIKLVKIPAKLTLIKNGEQTENPEKGL